ncbi:ATP-binding protein [Desulfatibacillum aliphaticivorans]|uniref:ATP-binding protein n=1 Tax=Desulfatibacillum aliphaticivorans TaxID=218208 RepID=UPI0003F4B5F7|nr:ATP-binding protein [Desulfatibacillum aliphaticivorans]
MAETGKAKTITIISGKGGTGKTSVTAAFASLAAPVVVADCDVDAANLHLLLSPEVEKSVDFYAMPIARINQDLCVGCGLCNDLCRYDAIVIQDDNYSVDPLACEACLVCKEHCPEQAIYTVERQAGYWFLSQARTGPMVHASLGIAQENSGKLVTEVRKAAADVAEEEKLDLVLVDGPPGIGCAVMASLTGADLVIAVTEATQSGLKDLIRVNDLCNHFKIPIHIIVNKCDLNPEVTQTVRKWAQEAKAPIIGEIPYDTDFTKAMIEAKTIVEYKSSRIGDELKNIWNTVLETMKSIA